VGGGEYIPKCTHENIEIPLLHLGHWKVLLEKLETLSQFLVKGQFLPLRTLSAQLKRIYVKV
jgi:hypothetical protein